MLECSNYITACMHNYSMHWDLHGSDDQADSQYSYKYVTCCTLAHMPIVDHKVIHNSFTPDVQIL